MLVAELGGPTMYARIGVMRALNRRVERVFNSSRKDKHWGRRNDESRRLSRHRSRRRCRNRGRSFRQLPDLRTVARHARPDSKCWRMFTTPRLRSAKVRSRAGRSAFMTRGAVSRSDARRPVALPAVRSAELRPSALVADRPSHPPLTVPSLA